MCKVLLQQRRSFRVLAKRTYCPRVQLGTTGNYMHRLTSEKCTIFLDWIRSSSQTIFEVPVLLVPIKTVINHIF